jgi:TonB family protein
MPYSPDQAVLGLLPPPERSSRAFVASAVVNLVVFSAAIYIAASAKQVIEQHYEMTELIAPTLPQPIKHERPPAPPKLKPLRLEAPKLEAPKLEAPKVEPPKIVEPKPVQMEAKLETPPIPRVRPQIKLALQPKPALAAAMPAQNNLMKPSTRPVHLGDTFGVVPNPNSVRPANIAAIGNPYGGMNGPAIAPHGVVRSAGIGDGTKFGSGGGGGGAVPGRTVASVGMPGTTPAASMPTAYSSPVQSTSVEVLSKPPVEYTGEARQLRIEGDVVLSVTFLASGQLVIHGVLHGLGHGLDQEAIREAQQIQFRPATRDGHPVDVTTRITITFQLA